MYDLLSNILAQYLYKFMSLLLVSQKTFTL